MTDKQNTSDQPGMEPDASMRWTPATEPTDLALDAEGHVIKAGHATDQPGMKPEGGMRWNGIATEPTDLSIDAEGHILRVHPVAEPQEPGMDPQAAIRNPATEPDEPGAEPDGIAKGSGF